MTGFAYGFIVEVLLKAFLGSYIPVILISLALLIAGVVSDAQTLANQDRWFVIGVVFITWFVDPWTLILGIILYVAGQIVRRRYPEYFE